MSNFPIWWDTTITVFNKYIDTQTNIIRWYKHTIDNCFWKYIGDKVTINDVVLETNSIICRIPKDKSFMEKYLWSQLPNDNMSKYFTLGQGDIIVKGKVTDEIDEYLKGHRSTDLLAKYKALQGCMEVQQFALDIGLGRNNEHYRVRGT